MNRQGLGVWVLILCGAVLWPGVGRGDELVRLTADTPWVVAADEPEAVRRAIADVERDWYKVMGVRPVILKAPPESWRGPVIYFGGRGAWTGELVKEAFPGAESFVLRVVKDGRGRAAIVATGADVRGMIYAAYAFSEEILGVDPWYFWVDKEPSFRGQIDIRADMVRTWGPPTFKYRGWFINDEDLLHGFAGDPMRENVFSLEMYDRIYETLLRLRGNMIAPATFPFADERCQELAARRGLVLNMHHILTVGLNTYRWPAKAPFSWKSHPEVLEKYWQSCIDAFRNYEVVWTVGFRGKHDRPFWAEEPSIQTPQERGAIISEAIARQVELIRKAHPDAPIITNLWAEGAELAHQGHLKIPAGVTVVWPDDGAGILRDEGRVQKGQGIYYHTAMLNSQANQLSEMVNPGRIYEQVGRFVKAGATEFLLVNVSDIRPVPLSTDCVLRMGWDARPYVGRSDAENMAGFLLDWSRRQFGADAAADVAAIYGGYFAIPYMGRESRLGENMLFTRLRKLDGAVAPLLAAGKPLPAGAVKSIREDAVVFTEKSIPRLRELLARAQALEARIPRERRDFYQSHVLTQIELHLQANVMLNAWGQGVVAYSEGKSEAAIERMRESLAAVDAAIGALHKAEYGRWRNWYQGEGFVGVVTSRDRILARLANLRGEAPPPARQPIGYGQLEEYQVPFLGNFPLLYPKAGGAKE